MIKKNYKIKLVNNLKNMNQLFNQFLINIQVSFKYSIIKNKNLML